MDQGEMDPTIKAGTVRVSPSLPITSFLLPVNHGAVSQVSPERLIGVILGRQTLDTDNATGCSKSA